jgi:hypothetical protein
LICLDFTRDGRQDMAFTLASVGTCVTHDLYVLRQTPDSRYTTALHFGGCKNGLSHRGGDVLRSRPVYRRGDPNCCPRGGALITRYRWTGTAFKWVGTLRAKRPYPRGFY